MGKVETRKEKEKEKKGKEECKKSTVKYRAP